MKENRYNPPHTEINENFTGNYETFKRFRDYLIKDKWGVNGATHLGNDVYEFHSTARGFQSGCCDTYAILIWEENEVIKYKTKVSGGFCSEEMDWLEILY